MAIEIIERLEEIKSYTLLGAKSVLTIDEAAMVSGLSKSTIYKMTCEKKIPHYKRGKMLYFDKAEIEQWMKQTRVSTNEENQSRAIAGVMMNAIEKGGNNA